MADILFFTGVRHEKQPAEAEVPEITACAVLCLAGSGRFTVAEIAAVLSLEEADVLRLAGTQEGEGLA